MPRDLQVNLAKADTHLHAESHCADLDKLVPDRLGMQS